MKSFFSSLLLLVVLLIIPSLLKAQIPKHLTPEPDKTPFIFNDVSNFIKAYEILAENHDTADVLQKHYFDKGSPGLKAYAKRYALTPEVLIVAIRKNPEVYRSVNQLPELIKGELDGYLTAFGKLKEYISGALFPPVYFLVADLSGIGTVSEEGLQISVEKWKPNNVLKHTALVTHEMTHYQQAMLTGPENYVAIYGKEKSLLALTIREGVAEFFAELITGAYTQENARKYVEENEADLWSKFQLEMSNKETGEWMWVKPNDSAIPEDAGYVFGAMIVKSYYDNSENKKSAIKEILSVTDYPLFLEKSKYASKFIKK